VMIDGGGGTRWEPELRLADVHAPELLMRLPRRGQEGSEETTEFIARWTWAALQAQPERRWYLSVATAMTLTSEPSERRTFTRFVARVYRYATWPHPWEGPPPPMDLSLNYDVQRFVTDNGFPPGE
jgi:hypothetical protein